MFLYIWYVFWILVAVAVYFVGFGYTGAFLDRIALPYGYAVIWPVVLVVAAIVYTLKYIYRCFYFLLSISLALGENLYEKATKKN